MPVRDIHVCYSVDRDAIRLVELSSNSGTAVAGVAGRARTGTGRDDTGPRIDPPNAVVEGVREIEIAFSVEADVEGPVEHGSVTAPPIPSKARWAGPAGCRDDPGLIGSGRPFELKKGILAWVPERATADVNYPV